MAKSKTVFRCQQCGFESPKWNGKCPSCGAWNSLVEETIQPAAAKAPASRKKADLSNFIQELQAVDTQEDIRYQTGIGELDRVLGGGLVKGSIVLLGGEPGIGKSTLLLQICEFFGASHSILYVSGEESTKQIKLRAERLHVTTESLYLLANNDAQSICDTIAACEPDIVIIDSIQTMQITELSSSPGSLTQVRECTNLFMHTAKQHDIPIFIVGHVNKDGAIAGPKVMEHIVDTVLYFEGERNFSYRILRAVKNRFGSTNEIGVFEMMESGLQEVPNPSAMLLEGRPLNVSGTCVTCVMEGSRPILAEVQVLVTKSSLPSPRRTANGFDYNRLFIILAILEKLCLYSSLTDKSISEHVTAFGELGLGGEVRSISNLTQRILEAERMGFQTCIIPKQSMRGLQTSNFQIQLVGVRTLKEAFDFLEQPQA